MKARHLITLGLAGYAGYYIYKNRHQLKEGFQSTKDSLIAAKIDLDNINDNLAIINEQKEYLLDMGDDLAYKFRVFNKEYQAHASEINKTLAKYKTSEDS